MRFLIMCLSILSMVAIIGCTKSQTCAQIEAPAVAYVAQNVVMQVCTCTDVVQVEAWLTSKIPSNIQSALCPAASGKAKSVIGSIICAPLIGTLSGAACSSIPTCSGNMNSAALSALVTACQNAI
jgi:hypothetical protein